MGPGALVTLRAPGGEFVVCGVLCVVCVFACLLARSLARLFVCLFVCLFACLWFWGALEARRARLVYHITSQGYASSKQRHDTIIHMGGGH